MATDQRVSLGTSENRVQEARPEEIPTEAVTLPSRGMVYPVGSPLHGTELVEIRSMNATDENILTSRALIRQGKAMSALLRNCILNRDVDPDSLLVGDRNAILIAIRVTGYGPEYHQEVECPECHERSEHCFDLSRLPIRYLGAQPVAPGENAFETRLPVSRLPARFKLLTGAEQRELDVTLERYKKMIGKDGVEPTVTTALLHSIVSIGDETDRTRLARAVERMPAGDSRHLRERMDAVSPGVDMVQEFRCPRCGGESEVDVPVGAELFWPKARG